MLNKHIMENNIAFWAQKRGLKYSFLSKELGVSLQTFSRWANNKTQPNIIESYKLSRLLNVSMEQLIKEEDQKNHDLKI
ncbi:putative transcriptional regulator [Cytobacillus horneckiae]